MRRSIIFCNHLVVRSNLATLTMSLSLFNSMPPLCKHKIFYIAHALEASYWWAPGLNYFSPGGDRIVGTLPTELGATTWVLGAGSSFSHWPITRRMLMHKIFQTYHLTQRITTSLVIASTLPSAPTQLSCPKTSDCCAGGKREKEIRFFHDITFSEVSFFYLLLGSWNHENNC